MRAFRRLPLIIIVLGAIATLLASACGGTDPDRPESDISAPTAAVPADRALESPADVATPDPTATSPSADTLGADEATPSAGATTSDTSRADPSPTPDPDYSPDVTMYGLFSGRDHRARLTREALEAAREHNDRSQVPVIIQLMRYGLFLGLRFEADSTLLLLTGQSFGSDPAVWGAWMLWLGENSSEFPPPPDYATWKAKLLSLLHPRFQDFLATAATTSRIDLTEVVWGGVAPDGIPDLQFPPTVPADQQDYLTDDEPVIGVSINGEHRAYPVRILNPHEMANDILGGEQIALAY